MKSLKVLPILVLTALLIMGGALGNTAQAKSLQFVNYTGKAISGLYISNSGAGYSKSNLIRSKINHNGTRSISIPSNAPRYINLKIRLSNGADWYWRNVDLMNVWRITFVQNGSKIRANWN